MSEVQAIDIGDPKQVIAWMHGFVNRNSLLKQSDCMMLGAFVGSLEETIQARDAAASLLERIAVALKGEPPAGSQWGFGDLLEIIEALKVKRQEVH